MLISFFLNECAAPRDTFLFESNAWSSPITSFLQIRKLKSFHTNCLLTLHNSCSDTSMINFLLLRKKSYCFLLNTLQRQKKTWFELHFRFRSLFKLLDSNLASLTNKN